MAQVFGFQPPRISRRDAARATALAKWIGATRTPRLDQWLGGVVSAAVGRGVVAADAAHAIVQIGGARIDVAIGGAAARAIAQRLVGGPAELAAARPLDATEQALWAAIVAAALEDLGVPGEVWPSIDGDPVPPTGEGIAIELSGAVNATVVIRANEELFVRVPPARPPAAWLATTKLDLLIALGRCALRREDLAGLAVRDIVTLERPAGGRAELVLGAGALGLRAAPGAVEAAVATGYVARDMALPDDAHLELTVALGTTRVSLRELTELAIGQVVPLGRPLAGPFELRAEGRVIGRGELVDVDGELGVRVVSLGQT